MLESIQGKRPDEAVIVLGDGTKERFRLPAYLSYFTNLKEQFTAAQNAFTGDTNTMPDPSLENDHGAWGSYAKQLMEESGSLAQVAGIRKTQIKRLYASGVKTLTQLVEVDQTSVKGIAPEMYEKIKAQLKHTQLVG